MHIVVDEPVETRIAPPSTPFHPYRIPDYKPTPQSPRLPWTPTTPTPLRRSPALPSKTDERPVVNANTVLCRCCGHCGRKS